MKRCRMIAGFVALGITTTVGAAGLGAGIGDEPKVAPRADGPMPSAKARSEGPGNSLAGELDHLKAQYEDAVWARSAPPPASATSKGDRADPAGIAPDYPGVVRRIFDLAATAPKDPAVRDAMLWIIEKAQNGSETLNPGEFALAASWLVRHHGDDPDAVRVGLRLDNWQTANRDHLLLGFYASAKGRESKGLARLALAQYLERKAMMAERSKKVEGRPAYVHDDFVRVDGTRYSQKEVMPDEEYAYLLHLKQCDVNYLRAESERLYEEVIADYSDVPYVTTRDRLLEALLRQPEPKWGGEPLTDEGRRKIEARIASHRSTLGRVAEARLDDWHNLAVGKLAPEIQGIDVYGNPLKLADYRGKVVAAVFWGTWCGPCMQQIPREKELVGRMKNRPFAMLGVNADADAGVARKVMEAQGITWPNWHDGEPGTGPIAQLYHVRSYPTVYVIDAEGKIRAKDAHGLALDQLVEKLVAEQEAAGR
ncbi:TlpA family protein disulfide reductase [Singulisphaera acidiphila]|nr:TlpA disulfide reductase family protein [Singulisphaera acidiphila]